MILLAEAFNPSSGAAVASVAAAVGTAAIAGGLAVYSERRGQREADRTEAQLDAVHRATPGSQPDVTFSQINKYNAALLGRSGAAFWSAQIAGAIGLATFIVGIVLFFLQPGGDVTPAALTTLSSAAVEAVAGLFLVQSNRATRAMTDGHDKLYGRQRVEDAFRATLMIEDDGARQETLRMIAVESMGASRAGAPRVKVKEIEGPKAKDGSKKEGETAEIRPALTNAPVPSPGRNQRIAVSNGPRGKRPLKQLPSNVGRTGSPSVTPPKREYRRGQQIGEPATVEAAGSRRARIDKEKETADLRRRNAELKNHLATGIAKQQDGQAQRHDESSEHVE